MQVCLPMCPPLQQSCCTHLASELWGCVAFAVRKLPQHQDDAVPCRPFAGCVSNVDFDACVQVFCQYCGGLIVEILVCRGSIKIEYTLARHGAERLWKLLKTEPFVNSLGALTGKPCSCCCLAWLPSPTHQLLSVNIGCWACPAVLQHKHFLTLDSSTFGCAGGQAVQMVKGGLKAIYCSGWQVAADANAAGQVCTTLPCMALMSCLCLPIMPTRLLSNRFQQHNIAVDGCLASPLAVCCL